MKITFKGMISSAEIDTIQDIMKGPPIPGEARWTLATAQGNLTVENWKGPLPLVGKDAEITIEVEVAS